MALVSKLKICPRPFRTLHSVDWCTGLFEWWNMESKREKNKNKNKTKAKKSNNNKKADTQMARHSQACGAVPWERYPQRRACWLEGLELWAGRRSPALWFFWCWRKQDIAHSCAVPGPHQRHLTLTYASSFWRDSFQTLGFVLSGLTEMLRFERLTCLAMLPPTSDVHREYSALLQIGFWWPQRAYKIVFGCSCSDGAF